MPAPDPVQLGPHRYVVPLAAEVRLGQYSRQLAALAHVGLPDLRPEEGELPTAFLMRAFGRAFASGRAIELVAAFLLPEGVDPSAWSPELYAQVVEELGSLGPEARDAFGGVLMEITCGAVAAHVPGRAPVEVQSVHT